ncbi:MAG: hypothetical protein ACI9VR_001518 [Cognaticolwellia sp.]
MTAALMILSMVLGCEKDSVDDTVVGQAWDTQLSFDARGMFMSVWGSGQGPVWVVGGQEDQGVVLRGDDDAWEAVPLPAGTPMLTWISGVSDADLWVCGLSGTLLHWDGGAWEDFGQPVEEAFWGMYTLGDSAVAVGGQFRNSGEQPIAYAWDGSAWSALELPAELPEIPNLFKVHHDGESFVVVGAQGISLKVKDGVTSGVPTGFTDDLVTLHRAQGGELIAVGGRGTGGIFTYDGSSWTQKQETIAGLSGVFDVGDGQVIAVGERGYAGVYDRNTDTFIERRPLAQDLLHAVWVSPSGKVYAVGGDFLSADFYGTLLTSESLF